MKKIIADQEIVELIKSENPKAINEAFRYLYKTCFHSINGFIRSNSGSKEDSADIFQESLIIFYKKVRKNEYEIRSSISAYLYGVSHNLWLKKIRKSRLDLSKLATEESYNFNEESVTEDTRLTVKEALNQIDNGCRKVLLDFYFKKLTMAQIAELYGLGSEEAAKNKKYRCLKKLIEYVKSKSLKQSDFSND